MSNGLDASSVAVLNIQAGSFTNTGGLKANSFNLYVAGNFDYADRGNVTASSFNLDVDGNFSNNDSNNNFILDSLTVSGNADITTNNYIQSGAIDVAGALTINANSYTYNSPNSDFVLAENDSLSISGDFTITANNYIQFGTLEILEVYGALVIDAKRNFSNSGSIITAGSLEITAGHTAINQGSIVSDSLDLTTDDFFRNLTGGDISVNTLNLSVAGDFDYVADYLNNGTITTNAFNLNVGGDFSNNDSANDFIWGANDSLTVLGNASVTADSYTQNGAIDVVGVLTINVESDFDYVADFDGTIDFNSLNLNVGGDFSNNDASSDFTWGANDVLTVLGSADITTDNYIQSGAIDVAGALTINANSYTYNSPNSDFVLGENDSLSISGDFTIATNNYIQFGTLVVDGDLTIESDRDFSNSGNITVTGALAIDTESNFANSGNITVTGALAIDSDRNFVNHGGITTESLNITTGYTAINQGSIVSDSLAITANDFFRNLTGGDVDVATLNITAGGKVTNTANITVGTLNIIANNDSSRTNDTTAFYVSNRGNITATTLNIAAVDNFYNRGNITATNFNITRAKAIFFLNKEIDSFYAAGHIYDGGNISLSGDSSFTADGGIIENYGNIDLGDFNLDITANRFINQAGANVTANTLNLDVNSLIQHGFINAVINH